MDERTALAVTAVEAVETADRARELWTDEDRAWASRAAAEVVGATATSSAFVARRAELALEKLRARANPVARMAQGWRWRPWLGGVLAAAAFAVGMAADAIGGAQRISILYSPVAPLVVWNLALYVALAAGYVVRYGDAGAPGPLRRLVAWLAGGLRRLRGRARDAVVITFVDEWTRHVGPLYAARAARILHVAAAALAVGVVAGLYLRGLAFEYRATWESTFLTADSVRTFVAIAYAPGTWLTGLPVPDAAHVASIRAPASENAALWLHLMSATLAVMVIVPRLVLAGTMAWVERYRSTHLRDQLDTPYFARLLRGFEGGPVVASVIPYSYAVSPAALDVLEAVVARAFGGRMTLAVEPAVAYGDEDALQAMNDAGVRGPRVALFNAAATPEAEAQGAFLRALAAAASSAHPLVVIVDESALNAHWGGDAQRRDGRRHLWREACAPVRCVPVFIDLDHPDLPVAEAALDAALEGSAEAQHDA